MITVETAEQIILSCVRDYGVEYVAYDKSMGRVLATDIACDRDLPAYNRVSMDGIAISYSAYASGNHGYPIIGTQAAGDKPIENTNANHCIEIMTGAALPPWADTVVPYEHLQVANGIATIVAPVVKQGQNIHKKGSDKKAGDLVVRAGTLIDATTINVAATVGMVQLPVRKLPRITIVSTGGELTDIDETPTDFQLRRSNSYTTKAVLQQFGINAQLAHIPDEPASMRTTIAGLLQGNDVLILSGGVSMGKYDHLPAVLAELGVEQLFHKVKQRPGKPFWFGKAASGQLVFAFPGNPVSTFMCLQRYFVPWLQKVLGTATRAVYAVLSKDVTFLPDLQYFMQVIVSMSNDGRLIADPAPGNGSGDLANLADTNAFMELPVGQTEFKAGAVYRVWMYKQLF